jgi:replicative DNA helicase
MQSLKQLLEKEMDHLINLQHIDKDSNAISSGFPNLDRAINGFKPKHLYLLGSKPCTGKTAFLLNIMMHLLVNKTNPIKVLMVSPDISGFELVKRIISLYSSTEMSKIFDQITDPEVLENIYVKMDELKDLSNNLLIEDHPICTIPGLRAQIESMEQKPGFIMIDNLDRITLPEAVDPVTGSILLMEQLKKIAIDFSVPILITTEVNIDPGEEFQLPNVRHLREKNIFVGEIDVVMFLLRPEYYTDVDNSDNVEPDDNEDESDDFMKQFNSSEPIASAFGEAHLRIVHNRFGAFETIRMKCNMEKQLFEEVNFSD